MDPDKRFAFSFDEYEVEHAARVSAEVGPLRVLTVCTGNIARSAFAAALLRAEAARAGAELEVSSAGTDAMVNDAPPEELLRIAESSGLDLSAHRGRRLSVELLGVSNLVLTASREHRAAAVRMMPSVRSRVFTLREFARVSTAVRATEGASPLDHRLVTAAIELRPALVPPADGHADDIADPYRRPIEAYRQAVTAITAAVHQSLGLGS